MRTSPLRAAARGARRRGLPLLAVVPAALALSAAPALAQSGIARRHDFTAPGCGGSGGISANEFVVPDGVTSMSVVIRGEKVGPYGGQGAELRGDIAVTPGEALYACVAEGGGEGGFGTNASGGRGGGYALLSRFDDLSNPLGIAGGGGGNGGTEEDDGGNNSNAGLIGGSAIFGSSNGIAAGGAGATQARAGAGGVNPDASVANGQAGSGHVGGAGGDGLNGGGGGGGGLWAGGGGAGELEFGQGGGGGGGTSTCAIPGCTSRHSNGGGLVSLNWTVPLTPTDTTLSIDNPTPNREGEINLTATVSPAPSGGTVEFQLDGQTIYGCETRAVDPTAGTATCRNWAPSDAGRHTVSAIYSGADEFDGSSDHDVPFEVVSSALSVSPSPDYAFGDVELGRGATKQFTLTNSGTGSLTIDAIDGVYLAEYIPRDRPDPSTDFSAVDDLCSGRTLAPSASCTVTVKFAPTALGERRGTLVVESDAWSDGEPVDLTGVGVEPRPQERQPEERQPEQRQPETPTTPTTPVTPAAPAPVVPAPAPAKPVETPAKPAAPAIGASSPLSPGKPAAVTQSGGVRLPLVCPPGQPCAVSGTLTLAITGGQARAAAKTTRILVRFSGVKVAAGKTKTLSLKLPASFVKEQQRKGVRKLRTTLTVNTTLGDGTRITRRQAVTLLIPRARAAQRAAPRQVERPSFTG